MAGINSNRVALPNCGDGLSSDTGAGRCRLCSVDPLRPHRLIPTPSCGRKLLAESSLSSVFCLIGVLKLALDPKS